MDNQKTATDIIFEVRDEICERYCKYDDIYMSEYHDPDDALHAKADQVCRNCPMMRLV